MKYPTRIVCLTEETTETLYLLEEDWRIVGISGFTVRPPRARKATFDVTGQLASAFAASYSRPEFEDRFRHVG